MNLVDKVALVTGAAGGIGQAVVAELLGASLRKVVACDLDLAPLSQSSGVSAGRIETLRLDVTSETDVAAAARDCSDINILINCHGIVVHAGYMEAASISAFRREMDVNYWGQVLMCRAFAPILGRNGGGALVNFLSPLAYITMPFCGSYCASKAASRALTEAMRAELAAQGTAVMSVCPGATDTRMLAHMNIPKSAPEVVAKAVIEGLRTGENEVWAGEGAAKMRRQLREEPELFAQQAAHHLRLSSFSAAG
jgi:NAD(P)-dependent dehydrogenase (short-subunit alcohol dehydrogenase family)